MSQKLKIAFLSVLGLSMLALNTGCTEDDVATGVVAGVIIGATVFDDDDGYRYRRGNRYRRPGRRWDGRRWDGRRYRGWHAHATDASFMAGTSTFRDQLVQKFKVNQNSAQKISSVLLDAQRGNWQVLQTVGFTERDAKRLSRMRLPSEVAMNNFAQAMNINYNTSVRMFAMLTSEAKAQFADFSSPAWETCLNTTGKWRTPQNLACSRATQKGCSPATGASQCAPR